MSDRSEEDQAGPPPLSERPRSQRPRSDRTLAEANHEPVEPTYRRALRLIHFLIRGLIRRDWRDQAKLPQTGGVVVVVNHISNVDPIAVAQYLAFSGRWGKFLAKDSLFRVPVVGRVLAGGRPDPGAPQHPDRRRRAEHRDRGSPPGQVRRRLPGGDDHDGPRSVADGRQDRSGPDRLRHRLSDRAGCPVGRAGHHVRQEDRVPEAAATQDLPADHRRSDPARTEDR